MGDKPNYVIVQDDADVLCIKDVGPWSKHLTVTNGAEIVVAELLEQLGGRRLEYIDSDGERDQILIEGGEFAGFGPAGE